MPVAVTRALMRAAAAGLLLLALVYQAKGTHELVAGTAPGAAVDLFNRDEEQALFVAGQNPFDHDTGSQPPWGYPAGVLFTWPPWPAVRVYFAVVNLVALGVVMIWAAGVGRGLPPEARWVLAGAVAAFGGACTATEIGQIGIVVAALLAASLWSDRRGAHVWTGLLMAVALIKPTIAAPFAVALLIAGRYRASLVAATYGVGASLVTWAITGAPPWRMLGQLARRAGGYALDGTIGPPDALAALGVAPAWINPMAVALVSLPGLLLMWRVRGSLAVCYAVAAVWGRLWTYHKSYDDIMLVFLMVPLGVAALRTPASRPALAACVVVGLLAWLPGRWLALDAVQIAQLAAWPVALGVLTQRFQSPLANA